jgi:hypothetical protein
MDEAGSARQMGLSANPLDNMLERHGNLSAACVRLQWRHPLLSFLGKRNRSNPYGSLQASGWRMVSDTHLASLCGMINPLPNYPGSKGGSGVAKRLVSLMPPHKVYVEAFLGGGAVLRIKRPSRLSIGIDADPSVVEAWLPFATPGLTLSAAIAGDDGGGPSLRKAMRPSSSGMTMPAGIVENGEAAAGSRSTIAARDEAVPLPSLTGTITSAMPNYLRSGIAMAGDGSRRSPGSIARKGVAQSLLCIAQADFLRQSASLRPVLLEPDTLVYCDPPYLMEVRTRPVYGVEMSDMQGHSLLLTLLESLPCMVMISHYPCPLYDDRLGSWRQVTYRCMTRGGPRTERCYLNFPDPPSLHDARFTGAGFRERERIKRKSSRWKARFAAMPAGERQLIASALAMVDPASLRAALSAGIAGGGDAS